MVVKYTFGKVVFSSVVKERGITGKVSHWLPLPLKPCG